MSWEKLLRMLRIRSVPMPDSKENAELTEARADVEKLHRKAERVLDDYAAADRQRIKNGMRK